MDELRPLPGETTSTATLASEAGNGRTSLAAQPDSAASGLRIVTAGISHSRRRSLIAVYAMTTTTMPREGAAAPARLAQSRSPPLITCARPTALVIVNFALALIAIVILVAGGALFFGVHMPSQLGGFVLSALLCIAAMFGMGLLITSLARSPQVAAVMGTVLLYPLLFFAGMWTRKQNLSPTLQHIGNYTPLNAAA